ncbi:MULTISPECIES: FAD-dependent oxidoreductase [unclassified Mesorhizobium]|uniref:NAD(P)/FAD-dependent oxidoreductase n=1 Tax=unclassified Mesorhizobium TaxID=325217 RepID=UPI0015E38663|nr:MULTISPECIES: FAD-dependent oxidoreductase [unclassified Mesorhizobium]
MQLNNRQTPPQFADAVIIGGGIQGLSCAYNLASEQGLRRVVVVDAGYWQGGASGRNETLVRSGFGSREWSEFFTYSCREWRDLSRRLRHNVMYSERGYMIVASSEQTADSVDSAARLHRQTGLRGQYASREKVERLLPGLDQSKVRCAYFLEEAGVAPHHAAMHAYLSACQDVGVEMIWSTPVDAIDTANGRVTGVWVAGALIRSDLVLVAAGAGSPEISKSVAYDLGGSVVRLQATALEPTQPFVHCAVTLLDLQTVLHQTARGEIVGGCGPSTDDITLRSDFLPMAQSMASYVTMFPQMAHLRILRQWSGLVHVSEDYAPLIGRCPHIDELWISAGWIYGHTGGPGAGRLIAKAMVGKGVDPLILPFDPDRFRRGKAIVEPLFIVGGSTNKVAATT